MIKKKNIALLLFCVMSVMIYGQRFEDQGNTAKAPESRKDKIIGLSDVKAYKTLRDIEKEFDTHEALQAHISVIVNDNGKNLEEVGVVTIKGKKYKIETPNQEIVADGSTSWLFLKKANYLQINNHEGIEGNMFLFPASLLKKYQKDYVAKHVGDKTINGKAVTIVEMTPYDNKASYQKIEVFVDKNTNQVYKMKVFESAKMQYTVTVNNLKSNNLKIADSFFTFDVSKVPSGSISDLRY